MAQIPRASKFTLVLTPQKENLWVYKNSVFYELSVKTNHILWRLTQFTTIRDSYRKSLVMP